MQLDQPINTEWKLPALPIDFRQWLGQRLLLRLCLESVQQLDWNNEPLSRAPRTPHRPQMLVTLLTYCYASAVYDSNEISALTDSDWTARYICAHNPPDARTLRQFRRRYQPALVQSIGWVLQEGVRQRLHELRQRCLDCPPHRLIREARQSAKVRVETAALMDMLASET